MNAKYTLAGLGLTIGLTIGLAVAAAAAPAAQLAKTGATLDGIKVSLGSFALGVLLAAGGYVINRRYLGGNGR